MQAITYLTLLVPVIAIITVICLLSNTTKITSKPPIYLTKYEVTNGVRLYNNSYRLENTCKFFIVFYTQEDCIPCAKVEKLLEVYSKDKGWIKKNFGKDDGVAHFWTVDADSTYGIELNKKLHIDVTPALLFYSTSDKTKPKHILIGTGEITINKINELILDMVDNSKT